MPSPQKNSYCLIFCKKSFLRWCIAGNLLANLRTFSQSCTKFFVRIIPDVKMICIFTNFKPEDARTVAETRRLANKFNEEKRFLRISVDDEGSTKCDYYMVYKGGLNTANFKETVEWINFVVNEWANFYNEE